VNQDLFLRNYNSHRHNLAGGGGGMGVQGRGNAHPIFFIPKKSFSFGTDLKGGKLKKIKIFYKRLFEWYKERKM